MEKILVCPRVTKEGPELELRPPRALSPPPFQDLHGHSKSKY